MEMGWKQAFMAEAMGISRSSLAHWEQFRAPVPQSVARHVKRAHRKVMKIVEELGDV
jgi:transcriptional regulator with XRE-family HTH domain